MTFCLIVRTFAASPGCDVEEFRAALHPILVCAYVCFGFCSRRHTEAVYETVTRWGRRGRINRSGTTIGKHVAEQLANFMLTCVCVCCVCLICSLFRITHTRGRRDWWWLCWAGQSRTQHLSDGSSCLTLGALVINDIKNGHIWVKFGQLNIHYVMLLYTHTNKIHSAHIPRHRRIFTLRAKVFAFSPRWLHFASKYHFNEGGRGCVCVCVRKFEKRLNNVGPAAAQFQASAAAPPQMMNSNNTVRQWRKGIRPSVCGVCGREHNNTARRQICSRCRHRRRRRD